MGDHDSGAAEVGHHDTTGIVVRLRAEHLDEVERRNSRGFDRWLSEGRVDADPRPFPTAAADL